MDVLFRPDTDTTIRIISKTGSWFAHLNTATEITCSHGETYRIEVDYRREVTSHDEGLVLNAFEAALRALVAQTEEQKVQATAGVKQLVAALTDECVYSTFTDPCTIPES